MKRILTAIAAGIFLLSPTTGFASCVIHLKDGTKFVADQYYEEGDEIKFQRYGGLIGIKKDRVSRIEKTSDSLEENQGRPDAAVSTAIVSDEPSGAEKEGGIEDKAGGKEGEQPATASQEPGDESEQAKAARIKAFLEEKRQIMQDMERATEAFKEAKKDNNDAEKEKWWIERVRLRNKLAELEDAVRSASNGTLPGWWEHTP